jgi:hypothetical protein
MRETQLNLCTIFISKVIEMSENCKNFFKEDLFQKLLPGGSTIFRKEDKRTAVPHVSLKG